MTKKAIITALARENKITKGLIKLVSCNEKQQHQLICKIGPYTCTTYGDNWDTSFGAMEDYIGDFMTANKIRV